MTSFRTAFAAIFGVLAVHGVALVLDLYTRVAWFDVPMHFFGGYAVALVGMACFSWILQRVDLKLKPGSAAQLREIRFARFAIEAVFVLGFMMIVGVAWEWYEFLSDQVYTMFSLHGVLAQPGLADTMDDLVNDSIGALTAWFLWRERS